MSQIGFVIITHSAPQQFIRLLRALNQLYSYPPIALHHDFGQCPAELSLTSNIKIVYPHVATRWCTYSVVDATLRSLALLYGEGKKPDWFALLSGACYPTKHAKEVISDLVNAGHDAYIDHELIDPSCLHSEFQYECFLRYFSWQIYLPRYYRYIRFGPRSLAAATSPYRTNHCRCYAGSEWFTGNRRVAEYILSSREKYSWLSKHLQNRHCPDETYFHTVLCNSPHFRLSKNHHRFIDWSEGRPHPKILEAQDFSSIVSSKSHFARKFEPNSPLIDLLDQHLGLQTVCARL